MATVSAVRLPSSFPATHGEMANGTRLGETATAESSKLQKNCTRCKETKPSGHLRVFAGSRRTKGTHNQHFRKRSTTVWCWNKSRSTHTCMRTHGVVVKYGVIADVTVVDWEPIGLAAHVIGLISINSTWNRSYIWYETKTKLKQK